MLSEQTISSIETLLAETDSAQGVVVQNGEVVIDWKTEESPVDVFAVQKGILTILIGIAEEKYLLETLDHVNHHLDPEWTQLSPWDEAKLSIETLLSMTTGMADDLSPLGEINQTWRYNNVAYNYLKQIITLQSDMSLQTLSDEWLFKPLGMTQTTWVEREQKLPSGHSISGLLSTARDLAQIGQLVLGKGSFAGEQILPSHYVDQMLSQTTTENPAWSWGWWNNHSDFYLSPMREAAGAISGPLVSNAPNDLIASRGAYGNYLHIVPSMELVVVRTCKPGTVKPRAFEPMLWEALG